MTTRAWSRKCWVTKRTEILLKACLMRFFDVWFGDVERHDGNLTQALAQLSNLGVSRDALLDPVDRVPANDARRCHGPAARF